MKIVILGPPGAGKGTQASRISQRFSIPHISTGDLLRAAVAAQSADGLEAKDYMDKGLLVPDEPIMNMMRDRLIEPDCSSGFLLDGFPRTAAQAESLSVITSLDMVLNIDVPFESILERMTGRRVCKDCGAVYHIKTLPSSEEGVCDRCGGETYQRIDDAVDTVSRRLDVYQTQTQPLIEYYSLLGILKVVDGHQDIDRVFEQLISLLDEIKVE